jgi:hypothetical protein
MLMIDLGVQFIRRTLVNMNGVMNFIFWRRLLLLDGPEDALRDSFLVRLYKLGRGLASRNPTHYLEHLSYVEKWQPISVAVRPDDGIYC